LPSILSGKPITVTEAIGVLGATPAGLGSGEASRRLAEYGWNEPVPRGSRTLISRLTRMLANPLVIVLLVASTVAFAAGQQIDAVIIFGMVALGVALNFVQTFRSEQSAERLRRSVAPNARVVRDEDEQVVLREAVVPGDVVLLAAGDLTPADAPA